MLRYSLCLFAFVVGCGESNPYGDRDSKCKQNCDNGDDPNDDDANPTIDLTKPRAANKLNFSLLNWLESLQPTNLTAEDVLKASATNPLGIFSWIRKSAVTAYSAPLYQQDEAVKKCLIAPHTEDLTMKEENVYFAEIPYGFCIPARVQSYNFGGSLEAPLALEEGIRVQIRTTQPILTPKSKKAHILELYPLNSLEGDAELVSFSSFTYAFWAHHYEARHFNKIGEKDTDFVHVRDQTQSDGLFLGSSELDPLEVTYAFAEESRSISIKGTYGSFTHLQGQGALIPDYQVTKRYIWKTQDFIMTSPTLTPDHLLQPSLDTVVSGQIDLEFHNVGISFRAIADTCRMQRVLVTVNKDTGARQEDLLGELNLCDNTVVDAQ